jgi:sensor histidine kinase YesM
MISGDEEFENLAARAVNGQPDPRALAYQRAANRVKKLRGFYHHLGIYVVVNSFLIAMNLITSPNRLWFYAPLLGWGIGLASHALRVFGFTSKWGANWEERKIQELMAKEDAEFQREQVKVVSTEKQVVEARLKMLQAQVEPHFLFNTLANVTSMIDAQPDKARHMLEKFIEYLRATLARTREAESTLGKEMDMIRAYLDIIQIRMGPRLRYNIEVPAALNSTTFPPMLLQPLVENAVKHGLEPTVEGGSLTINARVDNGLLRLSVEDDGLGFKGERSGGLGLVNVRERLQVLYDGRAKLVIEEHAPSGTRAIIELPANG